MSRKRKVVNYKDASESPPPIKIEDTNNPAIHLPKPIITFNGSLYESGRTVVYEDEYQFNILQINQFDIILEQDKKIPRIIGVIDTIDGPTNDDGIVLKSECPFEFWISHIKSPKLLRELLLKEWTNKSELATYKLPRSFRLKYKINQILWYSHIIYSCKCKSTCKCSSIPRFFKVTILKAVRPTYMGELTPPYFCRVFLNHSMIGKRLWAHEVSLYETKPPEDQPYEEIEHIIYSLVKSCPAYKPYCMLGASNVPRYFDIESSYYNKKETYKQDLPKILLASAYNALFEDEYQQELVFLLNKTFAQTVKVQSSTTTLRIRATKINLMRYGIFTSSFRFDYKLKIYLQLQKALFNYTKTDIEITLNMAQVEDIRNAISISKNEHGSKIDLTHEIKLKLNRKTNCLYVSKLSFDSKNRHIVVSEEEEKEGQEIDEDEIMAQITENDCY